MVPARISLNIQVERRPEWYLLTNVNVGLGSLESSRKRTSCVSLAGENMVHWVSSARTQQGGPAAPQEEVD